MEECARLGGGGGGGGGWVAASDGGDNFVDESRASYSVGGWWDGEVDTNAMAERHAIAETNALRLPRSPSPPGGFAGARAADASMGAGRDTPRSQARALRALRWNARNASVVASGD